MPLSTAERLLQLAVVVPVLLLPILVLAEHDGSAGPPAASVIRPVRPCSVRRCSVSSTSQCYQDHNNHRVLSDANTSSNSMTREYCAQFCFSALAPRAEASTLTLKKKTDDDDDDDDDRMVGGVGGVGGSGGVFAGVEFGHQCFCSTTLPNDTHPVPRAECSMPCPGNSSETCGNASRVDVFTVSSCQDVPLNFPYCDSAEPIPSRVSDLLSRMSLQDKLQAINSKTPSFPKFGVAQSWHEALHGLRYPCATDVSTKPDGLCPSRCVRPCVSAC